MQRQKHQKRPSRFKIELQGAIERNLVIEKLHERDIKTVGNKAIEDLPYKTLVLELAKSNYRGV